MQKKPKGFGCFIQLLCECHWIKSLWHLVSWLDYNSSRFIHAKQSDRHQRAKPIIHHKLLRHIYICIRVSMKSIIVLGFNLTKPIKESINLVPTTCISNKWVALAVVNNVQFKNTKSNAKRATYACMLIVYIQKPYWEQRDRPRGRPTEVQVEPGPVHTSQLSHCFYSILGSVCRSYERRSPQNCVLLVYKDDIL